MAPARSTRRPFTLHHLSPHIMVRIFQYLTMEELFGAMQVCRRWLHLIETYDSQLWAHYSLEELPPASLSDPSLLSSLSTFKNKLRAFRFSWNSSDCSRNNFVLADGFTVHRQPVAQSTDAIRGSIGVCQGIHCWELVWKGPLGTSAVVGVASKHAAMHSPGYVPLIGSDDQSWGFNLVDNTLLHNGSIISEYPRGTGSGNNGWTYQIGERLKMILNCDLNHLYFERDAQFLGLAFNRLPPIRFFPAISAVYGNSEISLVYLGQPVVG